MSSRLAMLYSLKVHILLVLALYTHASRVVTPKLSTQPKSFVELSNKGKFKPRKSYIIEATTDMTGRKCTKFYVGIGFYHEGDVVSEVIKGYPAYLNGLKAGDVIIAKNIPFKVNIAADMMVIRDGTFHHLKFTTTKICENEIDPN